MSEKMQDASIKDLLDDINPKYPPDNPNNGDMWADPVTGKLYIYYNDGTSSKWTTIG